jgi:hypothetical protein
MKNAFLYIILFFFTLNGYAVSAWVSPCHDVTGVQAEKNVGAKMPCHGTGKTSGNTVRHCKGVCLCQHVAFSPVLILQDHPPLTFAGVGDNPDMGPGTDQAREIVFPLLRPPRILS